MTQQDLKKRVRLLCVRYALSWTALVVMAFGVSGIALCASELPTFVVPPASQNVDGQNGAGDLHHTVHIQTIYAGSMFGAGPILIQEVRFRPSALYGYAFTSSIPNTQVNLSTSRANPEGLSTVFANNRGTNDT